MAPRAKGSAPSARSFYITFTRLAVNGTIELGSEGNRPRARRGMDGSRNCERTTQRGPRGWTGRLFTCTTDAKSKPTSSAAPMVRP